MTRALTSRKRHRFLRFVVGISDLPHSPHLEQSAGRKREARDVTCLPCGGAPARALCGRARVRWGLVRRRGHLSMRAIHAGACVELHCPRKRSNLGVVRRVLPRDEHLAAPRCSGPEVSVDHAITLHCVNETGESLSTSHEAPAPSRGAEIGAVPAFAHRATAGLTAFGRSRGKFLKVRTGTCPDIVKRKASWLIHRSARCARADGSPRGRIPPVEVQDGDRVSSDTRKASDGVAVAPPPVSPLLQEAATDAAPRRNSWR